MHPKVGFETNKTTIHASIQFNFEILILLSWIRKESNTAQSVAKKRYSKPRDGYMKKDKDLDWLTQANDGKIEKNLNLLLGINDVKEQDTSKPE